MVSQLNLLGCCLLPRTENKTQGKFCLLINLLDHSETPDNSRHRSHLGVHFVVAFSSTIITTVGILPFLYSTENFMRFRGKVKVISSNWWTFNACFYLQWILSLSLSHTRSSPLLPYPPTSLCPKPLCSPFSEVKRLLKLIQMFSSLFTPFLWLPPSLLLYPTSTF